MHIKQIILCDDCKNKITNEGYKIEIRKYHDSKIISCCHVSLQMLRESELEINF